MSEAYPCPYLLSAASINVWVIFLLYYVRYVLVDCDVSGLCAHQDGREAQSHGEERLRVKTGDLGRITRMVRTVFVPQSDDNLRLRARDRLRQWYAANGDDLD